MVIKTRDKKSIDPLLKELVIPSPTSHKGQNGKLLIIGGSSLFHSASIWAAEIASHFVDIVHYSSTKENNEIFRSLKHKFHNGIVIPQEHLREYVSEDDAILMGPGMVRGEIQPGTDSDSMDFEKIVRISDEPTLTYALVDFLIRSYPNKRFVIDAGALQMLKKDMLLELDVPPILTPHTKEFEDLFSVRISSLTQKEIVDCVVTQSFRYRCVILLKMGVDIVTDGVRTCIIEGGNPGLTKGGTGDILAGLTASFYTKNDAFVSAVFGSYLLKSSSDALFQSKGYWYNIDDIISIIPFVYKNIRFGEK